MSDRQPDKTDSALSDESSDQEQIGTAEPPALEDVVEKLLDEVFGEENRLAVLGDLVAQSMSPCVAQSMVVVRLHGDSNCEWHASNPVQPERCLMAGDGSRARLQYRRPDSNTVGRWR